MTETALAEPVGTIFVERRQLEQGSSGVNAERRQFRDGNRSDRPEVA